MKEEIVIPYGLLETIEMINMKYNHPISLLIDVISIGAWNKLCWYTRVGHIFHRDYIYTFLHFLKWQRLDKIVSKEVANIVLVSDYDGDYLKQFNRNVNIFVCRNGALKPSVKPHVPSDKVRMGILSSWSSVGAYEENNWFIRKYFLRYAKKNPNIELVVAGRGVFIEKLRGLPNVKVLGEVVDLADFFCNIDLFIAPNPKGCGILNRCLDAFAYKVPVVGHKNAFSGFGYMKDSYIPFEGYEQFVAAIEKLKNDTTLKQQLVSNASETIEKYNNWDCNIGILLDQLKEIVSKK